MNQEREFDSSFSTKKIDTDSIMKSEQDYHKKYYATGSILPLGDGLTGKSVLSRLMINKHISTLEHGDILLNTRKSLNIELEFSSDNIVVEDKEVTTSLQFYFSLDKDKKSILIQLHLMKS